jgi:predicted nucleic acid-binding protein
MENGTSEQIVTMMTIDNRHSFAYMDVVVYQSSESSCDVLLFRVSIAPQRQL